ncbi:MAG TPA: hypothetical protein VMK12_11555 [Anaeromyxobacteraceae bacterium]|nr:hypothetical protein [Anaeromyxobacteraceae bacterium]
MAVLAIALLSVGCGSSNELEAGPGKLTLTASAASAPSDGSWITLSIEAIDDRGEPGSDTASISTTHGRFRGFKDTGTVVLSRGLGTIELCCESNVDSLCVGPQVIQASWRGLAAYATVAFTELPDTSDTGSSLPSSP